MSWLNSLLNRPPHDEDNYDEMGGGPLRSIGKTISAIALFPIRVILIPFKDVFHNTGVELHEDASQLSLGTKLQRIGKTILLLPFRIALAPVKFLQSLWYQSWKDLMFVIPALAMIVFFGFVFTQVFARADRVEARYINGVRLALKENDFPLAKTYFKRIMLTKKLNAREKFQWANILARTDEPTRANQVFNELAPDDNIGYAPAHELKAISMSRSIGASSNDPDYLRKLQWHLKNSKVQFGQESPEILQAWATFHMASEDEDSAIKVLEKLAVTEPNSYLLIAQLHRSRGKESQRMEALKKAEGAYRELLKEDKFNNKARVALANVLAQNSKFTEAEQLLTKGLRLQPDAFTKRSASDFYVMMHDRARSESDDIKTQVDMLIRAMSFDSNYQPVYDRLMRLYLDNKDSDESDQVQEAFVNLVTGNESTPMAHLAYSNFLWEEGDHKKAEFHLEQAYKLDSKYVIVLNNLAWMLAQGENPDLDRAAKLVKTAIQAQPKDGRFRDTYGEILLKQGKFREAASELELALSGGALDLNSIHQKLGVVYENLGMDDLARKHREQAKSKK